MTKVTTDNQKLIEHLDEALDRILAVRVGLGIDEVPEPPAEALDAALAGNERAREARQEFQRALNNLRVADGEDARRDALFAIEEAANKLAAAALDCGWSVGFSAGRGGR